MRASTKAAIRGWIPPFVRDIRTAILTRATQNQRPEEIRLFQLVNGRVAGGLFAGVEYCESAQGSMIAPKLLGCYEKEIEPSLRAILETGYRHILNVGAAEGYYAVGILSRSARSRMIAYETDEGARLLMRELAEKNGVSDRLDIRGFCSKEDFASAVSAGGPGQLILCDIEGGEIDLLDPAFIPDLAGADILVELHDFVDLAISATIRKRFEATHEIETFVSRHRTLADLPAHIAMPAMTLLKLSSEHRPCTMEWYWMKAKRRATA